ncbi:MAG: DUF997 family protein [Planctomycetaceae bacterium]|nr:DUF997 family protein [Planctomycetaceae bacterium]
MSDATDKRADAPDDPVYLNARREALVILCLWAAAMMWAVPYCYFFGYHPVGDPAELKTILGIPSWVFWGVVVPWGTCCLASVALALWFIKDEDLEARS